MADARTAILNGAKAANSLHRDLGLRERLGRTGGGRIDVFGAISKLGATLMFQPLDKLLGAYLPGEEPGILITTQRNLPVQRFTGAHELGHLFLMHEPSFDDDNILRRAPFDTRARLNGQEREADAFASMFLVPVWLLALIMEQQGWTPAALAHPGTVYQLSLRLGTSYPATCHALERHKTISRVICERLLAIEPRKIKSSLLHEYTPPNWHVDVWLLTERDEGMFIEGGRNDLFVVRLRENSGAGYVWSFDDLKSAGFVLVKDDREATNDGQIGGPVTRCVTAHANGRVEGALTFYESRPWIPQQRLHEMHLAYDLRGPETAGMWEPQLIRALQAA